MAKDAWSILAVEDAVCVFLQKLPKPSRLLVAVSGGSDSIGLLVSLAENAPADVEIFAATVDHRLRSESASEAALVAGLCHDLRIPHQTLEWQGPKPESGISSAAREARYRLLCQAAQHVGANIILTGHTADDQMETVAMRSARGSAPDRPGLAGMAEVVLLHRRQWLVRPLLRTPRAAIRRYLRQRGHTWAEDPSNGDIRYERARTRKVLEGGSLDRLLEIDAAASRRCGLSEAAAGLLAEHASVHNAVLMRISPAGLAAEPAVLRYGLAHSAAVLGGREQAPGKSSMERVMRALVQGERTRIAAGRVIFDFRRDGLFLCRETRDLPDLTVPAQAILPWDGRFRVANTGTAAVSVGSGDVEGRAAELFPDAPASVALRAVRALPDVKRDRDAVVFKPILAPFDRFLPQFDLKLACVLAALFGCDNFPPFPLVDSEWKR